MNLLMIVLAAVFLALPTHASCIVPTSNAGEKAELGEAAKKIMGSATSWTEVKEGTDIKETKNTIVMKVNYVDPFKTTFSVGSMRAHLTKMCIVGKSLVITTNRGRVTLKRSDEHLSVGTIMGTYFVLPTKQVVTQSAELQRPAPIRSEADTRVLL